MELLTAAHSPGRLFRQCGTAAVCRRIQPQRTLAGEASEVERPMNSGDSQNVEAVGKLPHVGLLTHWSAELAIHDPTTLFKPGHIGHNR